MRGAPPLLLLGGLLLAGRPAAAAVPPDGLQLLRWSAERKLSQPVSGTQRVTLWTDAGTEVTVSEEDRSGRGESRTEVVRPRARKGLLMVEVDHQRWVYNPRTRVMVHSTTVGEAEPLADLDLIARNYQVTVRPEPEKVAGRAAWLVTVRSTAPGKPARRSWIDAVTGYPLKVEQVHADGSPQSVAEWESVDYRDSFSPRRFDPPAAREVREERSLGAEVPVGLEQVREALGTAPETTLAGGYALRDATRIGSGQDAVYHLRYHDGLGVVSLFLSRSGERLAGLQSADRLPLADGHATLHVDSHIHTLRWRSGPVFAALVGDVSNPLLSELADSTGCARRAAAYDLPTVAFDSWIVLPAVIFLTALAVWAFMWALTHRRRSPV